MCEDVNPWTIRQVLVLLNELDPYGLEPGLPDGAPEDEYDLEAAPIAQILINDGTITVDQVDAIWLKWFGEPLVAVVGPGETKQFVASLNRLLSQRLQEEARSSASGGTRESRGSRDRGALGSGTFA